MAENLVIKHGNKESLPSTKTKGTIYFAQDSSDKSHGKIYYDDPVSNTRADMTGCGYDMGKGAEIFNSYSGNSKNVASGDYSHAEGSSNTASGISSHVEGSGNTASGLISHAEGSGTKATNVCTHAEGGNTTASGEYSHAGGYYTIAKGNSQTVIGKYNTEDTNNSYSFIIGKGSSNNSRSNAFTVDWNGNVKFTGNAYANGNELATKIYSDSNLATAKSYSDTKHLELKTYSDSTFAKLNASNEFDGEQKFKHSTYCPTITDHANGIGCAFKASRGFFNQFLVDEIYIPKEAGNITINKYDSTSGGSMGGVKGIAKFLSNGSFSHGDSCSANSSYSYAGGVFTSTGSSGDTPSTIGTAAHAEGRYTYAEGFGAHAEGNGDGETTKNNAKGIGAHAEGYISNATGSGAHSEGRSTSASGEGAHSEGRATQANGAGAHAEGDTTKATAHGSHSEGVQTEASGSSSGPHAEGYYTKATAEGAHAEGAGTSTNPNQATAQGAHAEGTQTRATAQGAHAEGIGCVASGAGSHAEGDHTTASGRASHSAGTGTTANGDHQTIVGKYNDTTKGGLFIVGSGSSDTNRKNSFRVNTAGECYAGAIFTNGSADFAEYFEWEDGNILEEDRKGRFVTLINGKIRFANLNDNYILGAISSTGAFIGNSASENWQGKYLKNVFGEIQYEEIKIISDYDNSERIEMEPILNSEYNPEEEYIPRSERPEWDVVGLCGQVIVVDDGTCEVNGYCRPYVDGIASSFTIDDIDEDIPNFMKEFYLTTKGFRVMERLDENHIKVLIK